MLNNERPVGDQPIRGVVIEGCYLAVNVNAVLLRIHRFITSVNNGEPRMVNVGCLLVTKVLRMCVHHNRVGRATFGPPSSINLSQRELNDGFEQQLVV